MTALVSDWEKHFSFTFPSKNYFIWRHQIWQMCSSMVPKKCWLEWLEIQDGQEFFFQNFAEIVLYSQPKIQCPIVFHIFKLNINFKSRDHHGHDRMVVWSLDLQLPMQSVPITTNVVSTNPAQVRCTRYSGFLIQ